MRCSHCGATQYHLFNVHYQLRCESLSIFSCSIVHGRLYVRFSVLTNFNWNKRGQTSSPVHVAEIQRNSNRKENVCSPYNLLGSVLFSLCNVSGRSPNNILVWPHSNNIMSSNRNPLLHKDFLRNSSSSDRCETTHPTTTNQPNNTKHRSIQKGSVHCIVGAGGVGCLLSSI